jgi:hypothetical protein
MTTTVLTRKKTKAVDGLKRVFVVALLFFLSSMRRNEERKCVKCVVCPEAFVAFLLRVCARLRKRERRGGVICSLLGNVLFGGVQRQQR